MELTVAHEQTVGDKGVEVGVKVEILAEGVDGHDDAGKAVGQIEDGALILGQALVGDLSRRSLARRRIRHRSLSRSRS